MSALTLDGAVRDEVIEERVVAQRRAGDLVWCVVDDAAEESDGLRLRESRGTDAVRQLHLEGRRLVVELRHGALESLLQQRQGRAGGEPLAECPLRIAPEVVQT